MGDKFDSSIQKRFWDKVNKDGDCWLWTAGKNGDGYGYFAIAHRQMLRASRYSWEITSGPIPSGLFVLHKCDVKLCVKPDHLFLGTAKDNAVDCVTKGRNTRGRKTGRVVLYPDQVIQLRNQYAQGQKISQRQLGRDYGITQQAVQAIVTRRSWKWL